MAVSTNTQRTILNNRQTILYGQTPTAICRQQLCAMAEAAGMSVTDLAQKVVSGSTQDNLCLLREYHTTSRPHFTPFFDDLVTVVASDAQYKSNLVIESGVPRVDNQQDGTAVSMKMIDKDGKHGSKNIEIKKHTVKRNKHRRANLQRAFEKNTNMGRLLTERQGSREDTFEPRATASDHKRTEDNDRLECYRDHTSPFQVSGLLISKQSKPIFPPAHHRQATIDSQGSTKEPTSCDSEKGMCITNPYNSPIINNSLNFHKKRNQMLPCSNHVTSQVSVTNMDGKQSPYSPSPLPQGEEAMKETQVRMKTDEHIRVKQGATEGHISIQSASCISILSQISDKDDNNFLMGLLFDDNVRAKKQESTVQCLERKDKESSTKIERKDKGISTKENYTQTNYNYNQVLETLLFGESLAVPV